MPGFYRIFGKLWSEKQKTIALDFIIDRLTNSIRNTISGDSFQTEVSLFTNADAKQITRKGGWQFNWKAELANNSKGSLQIDHCK